MLGITINAVYTIKPNKIRLIAMITSFGYMYINPIFWSKITLYHFFEWETLHKLIKMNDNNIITETLISTLFKELCCSHCKNDFSKESFKIIEKHSDTLICNLICEKCGKDFGEIILNINPKTEKHTPLEIIEGPPPINYDDVIEAHRFIKKNFK